MELITSIFQQGYSVIVPFILLLGLLIFVHELGHFLVAKYFGVRVEVFSIGFGKKIFSFKRGDTTYALSLFPLGGYVKMFGDEVGAEVDPADKPFSFVHKPVLQRMAVVLAGPMMNLFFAIFLYLIIVMVGEDVKAPIVGDIHPTSIAYQTGFRDGDRVLKIGNEKVQSWNDIQEMLSKYIGATVDVEVSRAETHQNEILKVNPVAAPNPLIVALHSTIGDVQGLSNITLAPMIGVSINNLKSNSGINIAGLKTGDYINKVNEIDIKSFRELRKTLLSLQGKEVQISGERMKPEIDTSKVEGKTKEEVTEKFTLNIKLPELKSENDFWFERSDLYLAKVMPDTPASKAGIKSGDRMLSINGLGLDRWEDVQSQIKNYKESSGPLKIEISRDGQKLLFDLEPEFSETMSPQGMHEKRFTIGIVPWYAQTPPLVEKLIQDNLWSGFKRSIFKTYEVTIMTLNGFVKLFKSQISSKNIGGIISIGQAASETFKMGWMQFLTMMALVSVNLFVLNLLPVPVLDGGHMVFYTIEVLKGSPLSLKKMELAQRVGIVLLMSLMVFSLFNDFSRIFSSF